MIQMSFSHAANLLATTLSDNPSLSFCGISIDTRTLVPGNLFVAIPGSRVDGHDFIDAALEKGAVAALVTHRVNSSLPQLVVQDTVLALGKLAAAWRQPFHIPLVAVTGSNGKTTLKNMLAAIMTAACDGHADQVLSTKGTLNNHLGLPLTLAHLNSHHRFAAIEMGMNHLGEIAYLTQLAKPSVAVITNAAASHLAGVGGSIQGVARAKAEIFSGLPHDGIAILNKDDTFFSYWLESIQNRPHYTFGFDATADVTTTLEPAPFNFITPKGNICINLPLLGKHNIANALAATAAALAIGIDLNAIKKGLENIQAAPGRLQLHTLANGVKIIDDTYNANPYSLQAAVHTLTTFAGKKILVLGDMKELGNLAVSLHQEAGTAIRQAGIDYLFTYGELSANASHAFGEGAYHFNEQAKLVDALKPFLQNTTTILIKGSRSMSMEKIVAGLVA